MVALLSTAALIAYVALVVPLGTPARRQRHAGPVLAVGSCAHLLSLGLGWWQYGSVPLESMRWTLSALSLLVVAGWGLSRTRARMSALGPVLAVLAAALLTLSSFAPLGPDAVVTLRVLVLLHIGLVLLGFAGLIVSAAVAALYLWVGARLKAKRLVGIARMPNLEALDALGLRATAAGFVALSTGMAIGIGTLDSDSGATSVPDTTMWATAALWAWYAAALHLRLIMGWRGRVVALFGVVGLVGVGALVAVGFVLQGWHGFGA